MLSFIKDWVKDWVMWGWILFISLLASQDEMQPAIQQSGDAPSDPEAFADFCRQTQEKLREEEKNRAEKRTPPKPKGPSTTVKTLSRFRPQKTDPPLGHADTEQEEPAIKEEEDDLWLGSGQKLTRYAGLENLVLHDDTTEKSSSGEGQNFDNSFQEQSQPADETDKLWEELVSRYTAEESTKDKTKVLERHEPVYSKPETMKEKSTTPDPSEERLQQFLSRIDDASEDQTTGEARTIEEDFSNSFNLKESNDNENQIFIMIEDDDETNESSQTKEFFNSQFEKLSDEQENSFKTENNQNLFEIKTDTVSETSNYIFDVAAKAKDETVPEIVVSAADSEEETIELIDPKVIETQGEAVVLSSPEDNKSVGQPSESSTQAHISCSGDVEVKVEEVQEVDENKLNDPELKEEEVTFDVNLEQNEEAGEEVRNLDPCEDEKKLPTFDPVSDEADTTPFLKDLTLDPSSNIVGDPFTTTYEEFIDECTIAADGMEDQDVDELLNASELPITRQTVEKPEEPAIPSPVLDFKDEYIDHLQEEIEEHEDAPKETAKEIIVVKGIYTPSEASLEDNSASTDFDDERRHSNASRTKTMSESSCNLGDADQPENENILRLKAFGLTDSETEFISKIVANENAGATSPQRRDSNEGHTQENLEVKEGSDGNLLKFPAIPDLKSSKPETSEEEMFSEKIIVNRLDDVELDDSSDYASKLYFDKPMDTSLDFANDLKELTEKLDISVSKKLLPEIPEEESDDELLERSRSVSEGSEGVSADPLSEEEPEPKERDLAFDPTTLGQAGDDDNVPGYLDDVKDLLVPRARRKKPKRRFVELDEIFKVDPETEKRVKVKEEVLIKESENVDVKKLLETSFDPQVKAGVDQAGDGATSRPTGDSAGLTEQERIELQEIEKERESLRASQRKELERFLAMPYALTEDEQKELEEFLAEEENDRQLTAASEARLAAFLAEVRARLGEEPPEDDLDRYMELPPGLTEDEEILLTGDEVEKERGDFETEDEYKMYIKKRYLQQLEDERQLLLDEDEYGYDDEYDYDYDYEEDYSYEGESADGSYGAGEEERGNLASKDQAVGPDIPMKEGSSKGKSKRPKGRWAFAGLLPKASPKGSKTSLESRGSSKDGSIEDDTKNGKNSQTKFFRYGSLGPKRKKRENHKEITSEGVCCLNQESSKLKAQFEEKSPPLPSSDAVDLASTVTDEIKDADDEKCSTLDNKCATLAVDTKMTPIIPVFSRDADPSKKTLRALQSIENTQTNKENSKLNKLSTQANAFLNLDDSTLNMSLCTPLNSHYIPYVESISHIMGDFRSSTSRKVVKRVTKTTIKEEEAWPDEQPTSPQLDEFEKMEKEVMREIEKETEMNGKTKKDPTEKKKKKKKKKSDSEKENKKSAYQNRDDLLEKHVGPRIRSFDAAKMKSKFNKPKESTQVPTECRICGKPVFQMEKIVAEKASWHKNCFRCKECNKQLTLETYQSHEGSLYCKPHFKELFRPKAVVQNEADERKERLLRRPKMIVLESQPEQLPDDVVRSTSKPDYGLEDLQTLDMKQRFSMFENASRDDDQPKLEPVSVRRSQSLMSKARRFLGTDGEMNGDEDEEEYEEEEEEEEEEEDEDESGIVRANRRKKERPMSFSGMGDLKNAWEQKNRREELSQARKEEITRFRQMLCAGKNMALKEKFESGNLDQDDDEEGSRQKKSREFLKIDSKAKSLKERFEKGQPFIPEDESSEEEEYEEGEYDEDDEGEEITRREKKKNRRSCIIGEKAEVDEIFKEAETAKKARNVFKQIDSKLSHEGGNAVLRSQSFSQAPKEHRLSHDISHLSLQKTASTAEVVKASEKMDDFQVDTCDLANRFKFFATFEKRQEEEKDKKRKVFRMTPPREGVDDQGLRVDDVEVGRDPNLIKCTDNYEDEIDCRNTKNILQMFKKLEMGSDSDKEEDGPRPLKRFTPPPEDYEDESEYTEEEYTDDDDEDEDDDDEEDENGVRRPKFRDELLEMASSQSARKAANLRAKFEKWEERQNELNKNFAEEDEECMPSLDTAKNLRAMFENKAVEEPKPTLQKPQKINRFIIGGGEKCVSCDKKVYAMERLEILGRILHKTCFKCFKCNSRLSIGSFSFGGDKTYCTTHYKQLFVEKGSYEAFADQNGKWTKKIEEALNGDMMKSHD